VPQRASSPFDRARTAGWVLNPRARGADLRGGEADFVGIDVSKAHLDVAWDARPAIVRYVNDAQGCAALAHALRGAGLAIVEATGGYELEIVRALQSAGGPVAVVNPRRVRDFARAGGRLAKADRIDALVIAQFGRVMRPAPTPQIEAGRMPLADLVTRRRQVIEMVVAEENRLEHASPAVATLIKEHVAQLKDQLANIETGDRAGRSRRRGLEPPQGDPGKRARASARSRRRC
jgi:transposase